jgi:pyrroline-5-carboxylate reductase
MTENSYKIALAGCGKMGSAMARQWLAAGAAEHLYILDPNGVPPDWLTNDKITYCANEGVFLGHAAAWDILILAIKPQGMDDFCAAVKTHLPSALPVLSIAAGRTMASLHSHFGQGQPVIRAMPNTPAAIGRGVSVAISSPTVMAAQKDMAHALLSCLGLTQWVDDESLFDAVTALSGSGPAKVFALIEAMSAAGAKAGLEPLFAQTLARQTVIGAAALADAMSDVPAGILRENVTSPNGTTAAALSVLMDGRFQDVMDEAIAKAASRSRELSN